MRQKSRAPLQNGDYAMEMGARAATALMQDCELYNVYTNLDNELSNPVRKGTDVNRHQQGKRADYKEAKNRSGDPPASTQHSLLRASRRAKSLSFTTLTRGMALTIPG